MKDISQITGGNFKTPMLAVLLAAAIIIGVGGTVYISRLLNKQRQDEAEKAIVILSVMLLSLLLMAVSFALVPQLPHTIGVYCN